MKTISNRIRWKEQKLYDVKSGVLLPQLKSVHVAVIFSSILIFEIIVGIIIDFPTIFFISYFAIALSTAVLFKDEIFINSVLAPFAFISTASMIVDVIFLALAFVVHAPAAILSLIIVNTRKKFSLPVMMSASIIYTLWMYTIFVHIFEGFGDPAYTNIPYPWNIPAVLTLGIGIGTTLTSIGIWYFRSQRNSAVKNLKKI